MAPCLNKSSSIKLQFKQSLRCAHAICQDCFSKHFQLQTQRGAMPAPNEAPLSSCKCPAQNCPQILRVEDYKPYQSQKALVQREQETRKYIKKIYNKTREHFENDEAYDEYLE